MQRQRGELVPIGDALSGMGGPVAAIRDATPQALHHFTRFDQVNQLVSASEADPERGFMARLLALCSLPRTNPGTRKEYKRVNGPFTLYMTAIGDNKLPFGNFPRLLMAWVSTEAVRTQSRVLILGPSLAKFMKTLGVYSSGGGREQIKLRNQMKRLFNAHIQLLYEDQHGKQFVSSAIADRGEFWWDPKRPNERVLWDSKIRLGEDFFNEIISHPVPIEMNTLMALKRSPLGLDLDLPDLRAPRSATALLAAGVPSVRSGTGSGQRQSYRPSLPPQSAPRVKEDQAGLAGVELLDGSGGPDPLSFNPGHPTGTRTPAPRGIAPRFLPRRRAR